MTETVVSESLPRKIYDNIPSLGAILLIFICMISYFVQGGWKPSSTASLWLGLTLPFVTVIASLFMILVHVRHIMNRDPRWYFSIVLLGSFFIILILGFTLGLSDKWITLWYSMFGQAAAAGIFGMSSIGLIMGYFRVYIARSRLRALMIVVGLLGVAYGTGIIQTIAPWLGPIYLWEQAYVIGQVEFTVWMAYHIGEIALITRVILLQEKLRPR